MSVPLSYLGIVLIWSTTPLAVKWSTEGSSFIFAISCRIWLATVLSLVVLLLLKKKLPMSWRALQLYVASATGLYGAMMCIYWSSQYIPSGIMSIIFGTSPLVTGLMASIWLHEKALSPVKLIGMAIALGGLYLIFSEGPSMGRMAVYGILMNVAGVLIHSFTLVWVKSLRSDLPAISTTTGSLLIACIPYTITWWLMGGSIPVGITMETVSAIVYLALVGSLLAFVLMFYTLKHMDASTMALIPLITPVLSLSLGRYLNNEYMSWDVILGAGMIISGLAFYNWKMISRVFFSAHRFAKGNLIPLVTYCITSLRK